MILSAQKTKKKSGTGIYHVMLRGINGQTILGDNKDYERLIETIGRYRDVSKYVVKKKIQKVFGISDPKQISK